MSTATKPLADAAVRRQRALREKLRSLTAEADAWASLPATPGFQIHTSQIEAVCGGLTALHALITREIDDAEYSGVDRSATPPPAPRFLSPDAIEGFERRILAALEIWNAYREKFAFRLMAEQRRTLALMDDLAWHAYRPARDRAVASCSVTLDAVRQPPLVFPNPRWSPFARSREQRYELSDASGNWDALDDLDDWLRALPVPLIGIPWYQLAHLPDAVFVGHEVGHLVEEDLQLEEPLRAALLSALPPVVSGGDNTRQMAWSRHWRSEVFADVYGVLTTGPAYAAVLLDTLHGPNIEEERQPDLKRASTQQWNAYPTRALRARLACEAVKQLPDPRRTNIFSACAHELLAAWVAAHQQHTMAEYEEDIPKVVGAILNTPLDPFASGTPKAAKPLIEVLTFTLAMHQKAIAEAGRALNREALIETDDRILVAAAAMAFLRDPGTAALVEAGDRFRTRLIDTHHEEVRLLLMDAENARAPETPEQTAARHQKVAAALWQRFSALARS